ncbi:MAG: GIY-YIG nuclease family protein [Acidobacteriaceae bacterium]
MNSLSQFSCKMTWVELLSSEEIKAWVVDRKLPERVRRGELSYPGVYRFIFPEAVDGSARHTPFYVGEAGDVGKRLRSHFAHSSTEEKRDLKGKVILETGWQVRGSVQNSRGNCTLQVLKFETSINVCGVILNQHSFDCPFARRLIENWAILCSQRLDKLRQLNRGVPSSSKRFFQEMRRGQTVSRKLTSSGA